MTATTNTLTPGLNESSRRVVLPPALRNHSRKVDIVGIDANGYCGNVGDVIELNLSQDLSVYQIEVALYDVEGVEIESRMAIRKHGNTFSYKATEMVIEKMPVRICLMIHDQYKNRFMRESSLDTK
jgi:hypothetical protein